MLDTLVVFDNKLSGALPAGVLERNPNLGKRGVQQEQIRALTFLVVPMGVPNPSVV